MKLVFNHVSAFSYTVTEQTGIGTELDEGGKSGETGEALLVKVCTEQGDDEAVVEQAVEEVRDVAGQIGVDDLIIFPWAHLSQDLAPPETARELLETLEKPLESEGYQVTDVPFGWYKEFDIHSKGHPMSVLSREI